MSDAKMAEIKARAEKLKAIDAKRGKAVDVYEIDLTKMEIRGCEPTPSPSEDIEWLLARVAELEGENQAILNDLQRMLQPAGSPPPFPPLQFAQWIIREAAQKQSELTQQAAALAEERDAARRERDEARQAATAWNALMNSLEAIRDAATDPDFTSDQHLNAYIDVYTRLKQENAALTSQLAAAQQQLDTVSGALADAGDVTTSVDSVRIVVEQRDELKKQLAAANAERERLQEKANLLWQTLDEANDMLGDCTVQRCDFDHLRYETMRRCDEVLQSTPTPAPEA